MDYAFEAAAITVAIGAVLSVLLQGGVLDRDAAQHMPWRWRIGLRVADLWLAAIFLVVVFVVIGTALVAIADHTPMKAADRRVCLHLLGLAASYPAVIALARRIVPLFFPAPWESRARSADPVEFLLLGSIVSVGILAALSAVVHRHATLVSQWTIIAVVVAGVIVVCAIWPAFGHLGMQLERCSARRQAGSLRLVAQTVEASIPYLDDGQSIRILVGSIGDDTATCWLEAAEAKRVVRLLRDAQVVSDQPPSPDGTWGYDQGLVLMRPGDVRRRWPQVKGFFVDGTELLMRLRVRMPLDSERAGQPGASSARSSANCG